MKYYKIATETTIVNIYLVTGEDEDDAIENYDDGILIDSDAAYFEIVDIESLSKQEWDGLLGSLKKDK